MSDHPKLKASHFALETPMTVTVAETGADGNPWVASGESEYGPWVLYAVTLDGARRDFFPSAALAKEMSYLEGVTTGTEITITKLPSASGGPGVQWHVEPATDATRAAPRPASPAEEIDIPKPKAAPPPPPTSEMADGIDRLAWRALQTASAHFGRLDVGEYTTEDVRAWGATILIAYQKRGLTDTPDGVEF